MQTLANSYEHAWFAFCKNYTGFSLALLYAFSVGLIELHASQWTMCKVFPRIIFQIVFLILSTKIYHVIVCTQKNQLNEKVLLSTENICRNM